MLEFFMRLFRGESSGQTAKERLRLVLLSDHLALAPDVVEALKTDLLAVISRYVEVDEAHVDVTFEQREHEVAMLANIPIRSMKDRPARPALAIVTALPAPEAAAVDATATPPPSTETTPEVAAATTGSDAALPAEGDQPELVPAAEAPPPKPRKRRRRRAARAAARVQTETGEPLGTSAQA